MFKIVAGSLIVFIFLMVANLVELTEQIEYDNGRMHHEAMVEIDALQEEVDKLRHDVWVLREALMEIDLIEVEATFYAPMDPGAVEGMCYEGDPSVTASGHPVIIGETIAAPRDIPFGTRIWLEGFGWRTVHDRGSAITYNDDGLIRVDIAIDSRDEAYGRGREILRAYIAQRREPGSAKK